MKEFDYEVPYTCEYEVLDKHNNPFDCGEPACYKVWWDEYGRDAMLVCQEHFDFIKAKEEEE